MDAYQDIAENMPQLEAYQSLLKENPYTLTILGMIYADVLAFHKEALRYFKKTGKIGCIAFHISLN